MAGVGFVLILITALGYLLDWDREFTPLFIIGIVFLVIGMSMVKKEK